MRRRALASNPDEREPGEIEERRRWIREAVKILMLTDVPYAEVLKASTQAEDREYPRVAAGLRAGTLRKRLRDAGPLARFTQATYGTQFPSIVEMLDSYFEARAMEPAGRTVYSSAVQALGFFEKAGDVAKEDQIHQLPSVKAMAGEFSLAAATGSNARPVRQAPQLLLSMIVALETLVVEDLYAKYYRFYALAFLLRHWGGNAV